MSVSASEDGMQVATVLERRSSDVQVADVHFPGPSLDRQHRLVHNAPDNYPHAWTENGTAVLFESNELGSYAIYKQKIDGSPAQLLARSPGDASLPQLTPDGKWVLFQNFEKSPAHRADAIFRVPLSGGKLEQVPTHGTIDEVQCSVSAAGTCVLRETLGQDMVYFAFDPIRGQGKELGRTKWVENIFGDWTLSPDGTTIASAIHDADRPGIRLVTLSSPLPSLAVDIPVPGAGTLLEVSWAPDARGFYVEARTSTGNALLYVDRAGRSKVLREAVSGVWGVPSRDGKKLAFVALTGSSNVWVGHSPRSK